MYRRVGLGAVWSADGTSFSFPWYCDVVGSWGNSGIPGSQVGILAGFSDACAPPTQAQLTAMQQAQLTKIAAVNPAAAQASIDAGNQAASAYCLANPQECANYNSVPQQGQTMLDYIWSQVSGNPGYTACSSDPTSLSCWLSQNSTTVIIAGAILALLLLVKR